jgi:hypothetical protein
MRQPRILGDSASAMGQTAIKHVIESPDLVTTNTDKLQQKLDFDL